MMPLQDMQMDESSSSSLRRSLAGNNGPEGPVWVLVVVCVLFCFIWTPILFQRQCRRASRRRAESQAEEIIRVSLQNLSMLAALEHRATNMALEAPPVGGGGFAFRLSPEDRREFIKNILVSRRIVKISSVKKTSRDGDDISIMDDKSKEKSIGDPFGTQYNLLLADVANPTETAKHVAVEPCAICLNEYLEGEILCWSQSNRCKHVFHLECMEEWLLKHEECPCCRHNYLSLAEDDAENEGDGGTPSEIITRRRLTSRNSGRRADGDNINTSAADRVLHSTSLWYPSLQETPPILEPSRAAATNEDDGDVQTRNNQNLWSIELTSAMNALTASIANTISVRNSQETTDEASPRQADESDESDSSGELPPGNDAAEGFRVHSAGNTPATSLSGDEGQQSANTSDTVNEDISPESNASGTSDATSEDEEVDQQSVENGTNEQV